MLSNPASVFLIVSSAERRAVQEAIFFASELAGAGMHRSALIVNRVHRCEDSTAGVAETTARLTEPLGAPLARRVAQTHADVQLLARRDAEAVERLSRALDEPAPIRLSDRARDVRDVDGLVDLCHELFGSPPSG